MIVLDNHASGYVIGIGSNIEPEANVPRILFELLNRFGRVLISRILRTRPVGMASESEFLNLAVFVQTDLSSHVIKDICNDIEQSLGRDREDPERAQKDRVADLDILFKLDPAHSDVDLEHVEGIYFRAAVADLFSLLGLPAAERREYGEAVGLCGMSVGKMPATIDLDGRTGKVVIVEQCP